MVARPVVQLVQSRGKREEHKKRRPAGRRVQMPEKPQAFFPVFATSETAVTTPAMLWRSDGMMIFVD